MNKNSLDELCVNTIRMLSIDAVQKADSGHPGLPLGAAPMAYALWTHFLKHNPANPKWYNRDRFVLSAGHGSILLYSLLHLTGYAIPHLTVIHPADANETAVAWQVAIDDATLRIHS